MTEWRPIPGFPDYEVSDTGEVRSWRIQGSGGRAAAPHALRPNLHPTGYLYVAPRRDGRNVTIKVHHAVALAFIGPRPADQQVRHLNGNRTDNALTNLQYGTRSENMQDTLRHGTHVQAVKTQCPQGHAYDRQTKNGRGCILCNRQQQAKYYRRHVAGVRVECPCGDTVSKANLSRHQTSARHLAKASNQ